MKKTMLATVLFVALNTMAYGDQIVVDGLTHDDVLIRESASRYYVQVPSDGSVFSVAKSTVNPATVRIETDKDIRDALQARWQNARPEASFLNERDQATRIEKKTNAPVLITNLANKQREQQPGNSMTTSIHLQDVPLREALNALLQPHGLDYEVHDNTVVISSPERLRHEPRSPLQTRAYSLQSVMASQTLPKVAMSRAGYAGSGNQGGNYGGGYSAGNSNAGYSTGGNQGQQGGANRGYGGGGGQQGGGRGANGGGGNAHFSNISELFANIDDRLVGETPAIIGAQPIYSTRRFRY